MQNKQTNINNSNNISLDQSVLGISGLTGESPHDLTKLRPAVRAVTTFSSNLITQQDVNGPSSIHRIAKASQNNVIITAFQKEILAEHVIRALAVYTSHIRYSNKLYEQSLKTKTTVENAKIYARIQEIEKQRMDCVNHLVILHHAIACDEIERLKQNFQWFNKQEYSIYLQRKAELISLRNDASFAQKTILDKQISDQEKSRQYGLLEKQKLQYNNELHSLKYRNTFLKRILQDSAAEA